MRTSACVASSRLRAKRVAPGVQSLLILHFDADKLRADGLHLGDIARLYGDVSALFLGAEVELAEVTDQASLLALFAKLATAKRRFDVVVAIGHSNADGIKMAADYFASWADFALWLKPLKPRRLLLAACQAGRWSPGDALLGANRLLRRIYACPVNASKTFATMMLAAIPYVVENRRPSDKDVLWGQLAAIGFTGRQLREWRVSDKGKLESILYDQLADLADPIARQIPSALGSIARALLGA